MPKSRQTNATLNTPEDPAIKAGRLAYEEAVTKPLAAASTYANTVTSAINAELRMRFEEFVDNASGADALLLRDILTKHVALRDEGSIELSLPGAFAQAMNGAVVCVPDDIDIDWQKLVKALGKMRTNTYGDLLFPCLHAITTASGCTSPAEEFIVAILRDYYSHRLTPDNAADDLKEFRENYGLMSRWSAAFMENNPPLHVEAPAAQKGDVHA
jgi:hypothetical protein